MAEGGAVQFNVASTGEVILRQNGKRLSDIDLASRKAEEASLRRYEAARWLADVVQQDLPAQPSEEEFRLSLRSGIILCNVLNKVQPGSVQKVIEAPSDADVVPDGAALSAYQYFENIRNFLDSVEQMGIPAFEASDLEQGGKTFRIVNCILELKSYSVWKQGGGKRGGKFSASLKSASMNKQVVRKHSDLFTNSLSRNSSTVEKYLDCLATSNSLHDFVSELLSDKKPDEIPLIVENLLSKVLEEHEHQFTNRFEQNSKVIKGECWNENNGRDDESKGDNPTNQDGAKHQQNRTHVRGSIQELKCTLSSTKKEMEMLRAQYQEEVSSLGKHLKTLVHAASGYQKVLEENRKLYNQVQDLKGSIRVYCRIRPFMPGSPPCPSSVESIDEQNLTILTSLKYGKGKKSFTFNRVFGPSSSQEEVFSDTQQLIRSVLDGYNVCIFAYGQTGSGKTYTMTGPTELTEESLGVNYRALNDLFLISEQRKDGISYDVSVQMIEIYNEQVRDLLVTHGHNKRLEIRNNTSNGVNVPDANLVPVKTPSDVINLMNLGQKNRAVGSTAMNDRSSRSHSCLTVHVQGRNLTTGSVLRGCMHLVDLAGSERADKTEASGDRLKEAQHINRSLSALGDVISSLSRKSQHVPYRNSKLTQLLQDSLGGQAKTLMFVHISPELDAVGETISTLKFAERVSTVELGAARANKDNCEVKELREQVASLKAALSQKERGELDFQQPRCMSPDRLDLSTPATSSSDSCQSNGDINLIEVASTTMQCLDTESMNSPSWPSPRSMEIGKGDWVDKAAVVKKQGSNGNIWDKDGRQSPNKFFQKSSHNASKVYPKQSLKKTQRRNPENGLSRIHSESSGTDSDEQEVETSDSSELDYQLQPDVARNNHTTNRVGPKGGRSPLQVKSSPKRRSLIPQATTGKATNGSRSPLHKSTKQPPSATGKRKPGIGK